RRTLALRRRHLPPPPCRAARHRTAALRRLRAGRCPQPARRAAAAARMTAVRASITGRPAPPGIAPRDVVAGLRNDLSAVAGVRVGHHQRIGRGGRTGTTVVLPPAGSIAAVDVRGGGPGTRETDALDPRNIVPEAHAICLTGGSAYGLAAADGV